MTKAAIWCRHENDNIIAYDKKIPWNILSDTARFWRMVEGKTLVMGRMTYETMPQDKLAAHKIFVITHHEDYLTQDTRKHIPVVKMSQLKETGEDLYICGGRDIYQQFIEKDTVEIIVDNCYQGEIPAKTGEKAIEISASVESMQQKYRQISQTYEQDNVTTAICVKKGEFVAQDVLKHLLLAIEQK